MFPLFLLILFAIIEFAFVFSAMLGISYATRDAALIAAEAGSATNADCVILQAVEKDVRAPADKSRIQSVVIYRADKNGAEISGQSNTWERKGTYTTTDGTCTVPYTLPSSIGYPEGLPDAVTGDGGRCNYLNGCGTPVGGTAPRQLDIIGVRVTYKHTWVTPLGGLGGNGFGGQGGSPFILVQSNSMRMEPIL